MAELDRQNALDHVVVVMFENHSFDHLLASLYQPGEVNPSRVSSATRSRVG